MLREVRKRQAGLDCSMGYWAYGNRVAFISSMQECFGFVVESAELRHMLKTQFEILWSMSKRIDVPIEATKEFLGKPYSGYSSARAYILRLFIWRQRGTSPSSTYLKS